MQLRGLPTWLAPGSRVAGYLLEKLVGVGGMAAVFRARDVRLGRVVALKLLAGDEAVRERFVREARAVAAVDHPHIIPVYEAGEESGMQYIAMRFVGGDDLQVVIRREGGLRPRRAAAFISPVASALDAAHDAGLVHRDVKPANMLVDVGPGRPEHVYLSDFGLARGILSVDKLTRAGQFLGTPDYAAPEQISGASVDGRVDQYALACVAYELLTGSVPFRREEPLAALYAHLYAPPPRLTAVRHDLPETIDHVLARALAKAPEDRFDSCGDFADALRDALGVAPYDPGRPPSMATNSRVIPSKPTVVQTPVPPQGGASTQSMSGPVTGTWTAVVSADRAYYESLRAVNDQEADSISFPAHLPERRFPLAGTEVRIGRRSVSRGIEPEIDLAGPPTDTGVSRLHAKLIAGPGQHNWSVVDLRSGNGIQVNGKDVPSGETVPLRHGDRIHLGAWTVITITRG
ncbi:MAG TPA: FHA domain-containing serine/threonine-protein kinase [Trebonia sp.]|nr:FHA domain-containing serine/threonine-protein kinase [Trebonia sp.]